MVVQILELGIPPHKTKTVKESLIFCLLPEKTPVTKNKTFKEITMIESTKKAILPDERLLRIVAKNLAENTAEAKINNRIIGASILGLATICFVPVIMVTAICEGI